jgi:predicted O-linked N-acetylglucosamine transferase (SPINDLY family)
LELKPGYIDAQSTLANTLLDMGRISDAKVSYRKALSTNPHNASVHSNLLFCLLHDETEDATNLLAEYRKFGEKFGAPLPDDHSHHNLRNPDRCLEVGFVSADFRNHAVAFFIAPVLAHLAESRQLTLHDYSNCKVEDSVSERLRTHFKYWHPSASLNNDALEEKIRADKIDILIDLSGHSGDNRLLTFARKPAPVQASWIGYPATTGLPSMDYYLADRFLLPEGQYDDQFTEKIVRLPANVPFLPYQDAPPINALPALKNGRITFGSFNRLSKLNRTSIALWAKLLRALPESRMLLAAMPEDGKYETLTEWFTQEGIALDRLSFHTRCVLKDYLALHHQVDICLDTVPYNGGTTTFHALWMGVPTLTLAGNTLPSRVGIGILGHLDLQTFVARSAEEFVQIGLSWSDNLAALSDLRNGLRERFLNSAIGQPAMIATGLELALRIMWKRWCAGLPPESFEVSSPDARSAIHEARDD